MDSINHPWWQPLLDMRRSVSARPNIDTWDSGLLMGQCAHGHRASSLVVMPGLKVGGIDDLVAFVRGHREMGTCDACSGPIVAAAMLLGSWLPAARREVLVQTVDGELKEIVLHDRDRHAEVVDADHPTLAEIAPASETRAAQLSFSDEIGAVAERLQEVTERFPDYVPAWLELAACQKACGKPDEARRAVERAIELNPSEARAHFLLGDLLDETSDLDAALHAYECAIALDPSDPQAYVQRGIVLRRMERPRDALASYERGLELDPHHLMLLFNKSVLHHFEENPAAVQECLEQMRPSDLEEAEALRPRVQQLVREYASRAAVAEEWLNAARLFGLATLFDPEDIRTWSNLAVCQGRADLWLDAAATMRHLIEIDPERDGAREHLQACEDTIATMRGDGLVAIRSRHTIHYRDARGQERRMLNYLVKTESFRELGEVEISTLSLERDKDLVKLLVAKGHNRRVEDGKAGRPIVFHLRAAPHDDFLAFANATAWCAGDGTVVESAAVPIYLGEPEDRRLLTKPSPVPFTVPRVPEIERDSGDVFYPDSYAEYE